MRQRPNILFIVTDQQTAAAVSCAGNPWLSTPGMDRVAALGVRFSNCHATQPLCGPNRTCMMSGRLPHETGADRNLPARDDRVGDRPMLGRVLADAGYDCGLFGKWHVAAPTGDAERHGFADTWIASPGRIRDYDAQVTTRSLDFIRQERELPFFCFASYINPHNVCEWARGGAKLLRRLPNCTIPRVPPPEQCPPLPANFAVSPDEPSQLRWVHDEGPSAAMHYPTGDWDEGLWRQYLWAYYRMVEAVDRHIARLLDGLAACGTLEDTLIVFTSDHGEGCASHHWNQKQCLYEPVVNVPLLVGWKGVTPPATVDSTTLVSNGIDLMPTLCDAAGAPVPAGCSGRSFLGAARDLNAGDGHESIVLETTFARGKHDLGLTGRCLRTPPHKYIVYDRGECREQLFDMRSDRDERHNLVREPAARGVLAECRDRLASWCRDSGDPFPVVRNESQ